MVGNSGQWNPLAFGHRSRGQSDIAYLRYDLGIVIEGLVEIAKAEEQNSLGMLSLDLQVLLPHGRHAGHISILRSGGHPLLSGPTPP